MNISLPLKMAADAEPHRIGLTCEGRDLTYAELFRAAQRAALLFQASGCRIVVLLDVASIATPIAVAGAALAGLPYAPLNYRLSDAQLLRQLQRVAPAYVVSDGARLHLARQIPTNIVAARADFVERVLADTEAEIEAPEDAEAVAVQLFTSGTTSEPKAAILRHGNLMSYILGTVEFASAEPAEAALVSAPPYHIAGIAALLSSTYGMRRMVLLPNFEPDAWIELCAAERVTSAFLVPTMLARIIERLGDMSERPDLSALRAIAYGGGRMPLELIERALDLFPSTAFTNAYGLTETSSTIALLGPQEHRDAHRADDPLVRRRLGSVGRPLPTVELEVRDETGQPVPPGTPGEIFVRGPQVSGEYLERRAIGVDGWFPTRDAGFLDEEGYLFLCGRADDVIVRGGENISPNEIEDVLIGHPAIEDAAVVGIPSVEWGEAIGVALVCGSNVMPSSEEIGDWVRTRLRSSRMPSKILYVEALPYNETGKLLRREVRRLFAAGTA
jgi:acyl-CoA synthetase (AMP-forming)/AMP-acid ligase II